MSETAGTRATGLGVWWEAVRRDRKATIGAMIIAVFVFIGIFGPWLAGDADELVGIPLQPPSAEHWLGTTGQGQDVLAQLVAGTRVSLAIGFSVGLTVVLVGALIGVTAGYFGGRVDGLLSLLFNVFLVIPGLPLAIVIAAYLPSGPLTLGLVLVVTGCDLLSRYRVPLGPFFEIASEQVMIVLVVSPAEIRFRPAEPIPDYVSLDADAPFDYLRSAVGEEAVINTVEELS